MSLSGRYFEFIAVVIIFVFLFLMRVTFLDADPPRGLSSSTDVYTDPPQYTLSARNYVLTGDSNPLNDSRFPLFENSTVSWLAVAVFSITGVGLWQSNFVGLLFSLGSLLMFYLFVRKTGGSLAALLFLIAAGTNYNLLFYGRFPFLEHAMAFFAFLALVLFAYGRTRTSILSSGAALAFAIFFSKMIGLVFLFPFAVLLVVGFFSTDQVPSRQRLRTPLLFATGFLIVAAIWALFVFTPSLSTTSGYLAEQSLSLYGPPEGLVSIDDFLFKMVSFGRKDILFARMPVAAILAAFFIIVLLSRAWSARSREEKMSLLGRLFLVAMILSFYGALMIWNYRPLRYQLVLIYPVIASACLLLGSFWSKREDRITQSRFWLTLPAVWLMSMVAGYQFGKEIGAINSFSFFWSDYRNWLIVGSLLFSGAIILLLRRISGRPFIHGSIISRIAVVILFTGMIAPGVYSYSSWFPQATFTTRDYSRDLGDILSPEAVLSGPFAPLLALENRLGVLIHMFGVSQPDPNLFHRFPVTHLLVDRMNEKRAGKDYPELFHPPVCLAVLQVGEETVRLLRIAGRTGSVSADSYDLSIFERALELNQADAASVNSALTDQFFRIYPDNGLAHLIVGDWAESADLYDEARRHFKKAVELSPTNYVLNERLASYYENACKRTGDSLWCSKARDWYKKALRYAPENRSLRLGLERMDGK